MSNLSEQQIGQLHGAMSFISLTLANRHRPLMKSRLRPDLYESITAAIYLMSSASSPQFLSRESRLKSFSNVWWPAGGQTVEDMVESGFYYTGDADHVKCFFCDLGLKDWAPGDTPESEHAKFSPLCFFLKSSRGLGWLRGNFESARNFVWSSEDQYELLHQLHEEFKSSNARIACGLGFSDTSVLLCIARKFIRFRQKFDRSDLVTELQSDWDKEFVMAHGREPVYASVFDLACVVKAFNP